MNLGVLPTCSLEVTVHTEHVRIYIQNAFDTKSGIQLALTEPHQLWGGGGHVATWIAILTLKPALQLGV